MNKVIFHDEENGLSRKNNINQSSKMTIFIKKYSFGLVKTDKQADTVKLALIAIGLIWGAFLLLVEDENTIQPPSQELIDSPQPGGRQ